jgi:hypothetical protein
MKIETKEEFKKLLIELAEGLHHVRLENGIWLPLPDRYREVAEAVDVYIRQTYLLR